MSLLNVSLPNLGSVAFITLVGRNLYQTPPANATAPRVALMRSRRGVRLWTAVPFLARFFTGDPEYGNRRRPSRYRLVHVPAKRPQSRLVTHVASDRDELCRSRRNGYRSGHDKPASRCR